MTPETLEWHAAPYAVLRLPPGRRIDPDKRFRAVLNEPDATTVVVPEDDPAFRSEGERSGPWRLLRLAGPLPHDAVGILARLAGVLAGEGVPIFALSTFDTDYVLVPADRAGAADRALRSAGYTLRNRP